MKILCIKGYKLGGSIAIMKGEMFELINADENTFIGMDGRSRCPGMEIDFSEDELADYFELIYNGK